MAEHEFITAPMMATIDRGVIVDQPIGQMAPPQVGPMGGVSVGPGHIPTVGGVIHIAFHERDGTTVLATFGRAAFRELALSVNAAAERVEAGEFDQARRAQ